MLNIQTTTVTASNGPRPNGQPDKCFYCGQLLGSEHKNDCVLRKKTVVVKMTLEYVIDVPEHWDGAMINFHRNEATWCAENAIDEINKLQEHLDSIDGCLCHQTVFEYLREATAEDEATLGYPPLDD